MSLLRVDREDRSGVAIVTLDDPDRRNALSIEMVCEIIAAFDALEADPSVGAVVVTGADSTFCAGADLGDLGKAQHKDLREIYEGFLRVARCPLPTVAAVNGPAVGAGMNLAVACDVRVVAPGARFDSRFLHLGLHPGGGHTWMLNRLAGPQTGAAMVLFGEVVTGADAVRAGLAWKSVAAGKDLLDVAVTLAAAAQEVPRAKLAVRTKATLLDMADVTTQGEAVEVELEAQVWSLGQPFFAERLAALRSRVQRRQ